MPLSFNALARLCLTVGLASGLLATSPSPAAADLPPLNDGLFDPTDLALLEVAADSVASESVAVVVTTESGLEVIEIGASDPDELAAALDEVDGVVAAEPNGDWELLDASSATVAGRGTDPLTYLQSNHGAINVRPDRSANGVLVAVIDSGVKTHADLPAQVGGWNAIAHNTDAGPSTDHGTMVAGSITALTGNGIGIDATVDGITIMPVKVCDATTCSYSAVAEGIIWATDRGGPRVINLSLGGSYSEVTTAAINYALDRDVVIIAAAGNNGTTGNPTMYPASQPGVIGVGAYRGNGSATTWASFGSWVDISAPGEAVTTLSASGTGYAQATGTSFAAPQVAAAAALLRATNPAANRSQVEAALLDSARDIHLGGRDDQTGWGSLNISAAVSLMELRMANPGASFGKATAPAPAAGTVAAATSIGELLNASDYQARDADTLRLYRAFLGREPDLAGAKHWIATSRTGASAEAIAWGFSNSSEFTNTYGAGLSNGDFLTIVYRNILGRTSDQSGFNYWLGLLGQGTPRYSAVRWIAAAPEFISLYPYR